MSKEWIVHTGSQQQKDCIAILKAGVAALDPERAVTKALERHGNVLRLGIRNISLAKRRVFVIGAGKASGALAAGIEAVLGNTITAGFVIDVEPRKLNRITVTAGDHPIVSAKNVKFTQHILKLAASITVNDLVICLFSGGGSALCSQPLIPLPDYQALMNDLLRSGATINELNTVRKHVDGIKGGRLAELLYPATVLTLLVSDVPGNDAATIASGPTVRDTTTIADARNILAAYGINQVKLTETPKDETLYRKVTNTIILDSTKALDAMRNVANALHLNTILFPNVHGEARDTGKRLLAQLAPRTAVIAAGETTVTVKGHGKGGRNQELVLGSVETLATLKKTALASLGSDGADNSDMAGAIADDTTLAKAKKLALDPRAFLADNNSYAFFKKINGHIKTGKTGTNVSDLLVAVKL